MALFPDCTIRTLLPNGIVIPGGRLDGFVELEVPEPIPRAERIHLFFQSRAWAGYGSGKNRSVHSRDLFLAPFIMDLPKDGPLPAGTHRFAFSLDVPAWLPPNYVGNDCAIEHVIETRVDVDWAVDPKVRVVPRVIAAPCQGTRSPLTMRSPANFHDAIVLEVSLGSTVRAVDEPLAGTLALRGGHEARFDAVVVTLQSVATMAMARGDRRLGAGVAIRIPAERLRNGEAVPFLFPADPNMPSTVRSGFIDTGAVVRVTVDIPWAADPSFEIPIDVLPVGSTVLGDANVVAIGGERLRLIAEAMARATGLGFGRAPTFVTGNVGPARLHVDDGPRNGRLGIDVGIAFPDVDLGITFRPLGMLEGFRESPLLPKTLDQRYLLRVASEGAPIAEPALRAFFAAVLGGLESADDVQLADHHLRMHFPLANDGADQMVDVARFAEARARAIVDAIAALPFPIAAAQAAWQATAAEQNAFLVPNSPALYGLGVYARIVGGESRALAITLRTAWKNGSPSTLAEVDFSGAPLSKEALLEIARGSERLAAVRAVFPSMSGIAPDRVAFEQPTFATDPRTLFPAFEALLAWVLETRGERSAVQPYR